MKEGKSFDIPKQRILTAYRCVKANKGADGVNGVNFEDYENNIKDNLYKLWNRMSSGSYFPKAEKGVEIPIIRGWMNYFMKYCSREAGKEIDYVNRTMIQWAKRKYESIRKINGKVWIMLARLAQSNPNLFYHWKMGIRPMIK